MQQDDEENGASHVSLPIEQADEDDATSSRRAAPPYSSEPHKAVKYVWWNEKKTTAIYCAVIGRWVYIVLYRENNNFQRKDVRAFPFMLEANDDEEVDVDFQAACTDDHRVVFVSLQAYNRRMQKQNDIRSYILEHGLINEIMEKSLTSNRSITTFDESTVWNNTENRTVMNLLYMYQTVWYFIPGNYAGNEGSGSSVTTNIIAFLFLIAVAIVLMNVLIGLINDSVKQIEYHRGVSIAITKRSSHILNCTGGSHINGGARKGQSLCVRLVDRQTLTANVVVRFPRELCFLASEEKVEQEKEHWKGWTRKHDPKSSILMNQPDRGKEESDKNDVKEDWRYIMKRMDDLLAMDDAEGNNDNSKYESDDEDSLLSTIEGKF
ncbi:hypothetical protein BZG36_00124 [Bifiguratus adelaidae]|uniref:Uncharacterized protein n=1 Tax=Bifiguratus adelaidae TaxID=1938954 RepID=A0A261Y8B4_9FUNG|nr:hypothetical protein BZG36_00124 [Bifiguratus adelaidae]